MRTQRACARSATRFRVARESSTRCRARPGAVSVMLPPTSTSPPSLTSGTRDAIARRGQRCRDRAEREGASAADDELRVAPDDRCVPGGDRRRPGQRRRGQRDLAAGPDEGTRLRHEHRGGKGDFDARELEVLAPEVDRSAGRSRRAIACLEMKRAAARERATRRSTDHASGNGAPPATSVARPRQIVPSLSTSVAAPRVARSTARLASDAGARAAPASASSMSATASSRMRRIGFVAGRNARCVSAPARARRERCRARPGRSASPRRWRARTRAATPRAPRRASRNRPPRTRHGRDRPAIRAA